MGMTTKIYKFLFVVTFVNASRNIIIMFWNYVPFIEHVLFFLNSLLSFLSC